MQFENISIMVLSVSAVLLLLSVYIVIFSRIFQRRQQQNRQEKAALQAKFEQEILTSQNEIQEQTMQYISQELHDNVVQMLSLVKIQLNGFQQKAPTNEELTASKTHLNTAITDLRALSKTLNTDNILHEGLANAICFELKRIEKTGVMAIEFIENIEQIGLDHKEEIIVFRVFQELIQNILKHAQAKNMVVCLEASKKGFKLEVQDNGIGFDFDKKRQNSGFESGAGLKNMVHRVNLLKGTLEVVAADGQGTRTTITIPHDHHRSH